MKLLVLIFILLILCFLPILLCACNDSDNIPSEKTADELFVSGKITFGDLPLANVYVFVNGSLRYQTDDTGTFYLDSLNVKDVLSFSADGYTFSCNSLEIAESDSFITVFAYLFEPYTVTVSSNNPAHQNTGAHQVYDCIDLTASENDDSVFLGWYIGDSLLSDRKSFRYYPSADTSVYAKYVLAPLAPVLTFSGGILSWDICENALGYEIYVDGTYIETVFASSYDISHLLKEGNSYMIEVAAINECFSRTGSISVEIPVAEPPADDNPEEIFSNEFLSASAIGDECFCIFYARSNVEYFELYLNDTFFFTSDIVSVPDINLDKCETAGKTTVLIDNKEYYCIFVNVSSFLYTGYNYLSVVLYDNAYIAELYTFFVYEPKLDAPESVYISDGVLYWEYASSANFEIYLNNALVAVVSDSRFYDFSSLPITENDVIQIVATKDGYTSSEPVQISVTP